MAYERLRAEYDAAFDRLRAAVWKLRAITQELSSDKMAEEAARQRVDQALGLYRECRNNLAGFLISHQPAGKPAVSVGSQPLAAMNTPWGDIAVSDAHVHFFSHGFLSLLTREPVAFVAAKLGWEAPPVEPEDLAARWVAELDCYGVGRARLIASLPGVTKVR